MNVSLYHLHPLRRKITCLMNVTRQLMLKCRLYKRGQDTIHSYRFPSRCVSHMAQQDVIKKLKNKGQNILFIVIISRGDKKLKK